VLTGTTQESQSLAKWPTADALCAHCRTLTIDGAPCPDAEHHRIYALGDALGREQLMTDVWGPPGLRRRMKELGKAGATGGGAGGLLDCGGCDPGFASSELGVVVLTIVVVGFVFMLGYWLLTATARFLRRRRHTLTPTGAVAPAPHCGHATGMIGVVAPQATLTSPLGAQTCVAYAIEFSYRSGWRRRGVMLREATTKGFELMLSSGAIVRIPAGPIVLDMQSAASVRPSEESLARYRLKLDPQRTRYDDLELFPQDQIREETIGVGDRIELRSPVKEVVDGAGRPGSYRTSPATYLVPQGVPRLRLIS
tara:strand:+ start:60168 stop:61097 length:930 start_codon:yes stop_codon:yes gene_type:complete